MHFIFEALILQENIHVHVHVRNRKNIDANKLYTNLSDANFLT